MAEDEEKTQNKKIEVTAKTIESTKDVVTASEGVVVYYDNSVIKATKAIYNRNTKLLKLDGNIEMIGYQGTKEHSSHMEIYTDSKEIRFEKLFFSSDNDVWLFTDHAHRVDGNYTFGRSIFSSCEVDNPLWTMDFDHAIYDSKEKYMKVFDAKVSFLDVPFFYTPYLAFTTHNKRSSGLLFPELGYSALEGFLYEQPVFWAITDSMDLEFNPQLRTSRSVGMYSTFRFADSAHSSGKVRMGYFKDTQRYATEENLPNDSHYGLEFNYASSQVFQKNLPIGFTDGLYVNTTFLNDIDYINLQKDKLIHFGLTPLQESRVNYFAYSDAYYFGLNAKYFIDTRNAVDKDKTLQILPSLQAHKYLTHFLFDNLTYSVDFKINNLHREEGVTMRQAEFRIPLEFTTSFFDDFLNVSLGEEFFYSKYFFNNGTFVHDAFKYYSNIHKVKIFTDLVKKFDTFMHVFQPSISYIKPGNETQSPVGFSLLKEEQKELFAVGLPQEQYDLSLSQYFYDHSMNLKFYQRFSQKYYRNKKHKLADMTNEMQYNWKQWSAYHNFVYSHEFDKVRESSARISLIKPEYNFSLGHTYKQVLPDLPYVSEANDFDFSFGYTYNEQISLHGGLTYNLDEASSKQWRFGGAYHRDCWRVDASIRQDITPRPSGFTKDNTYYLQFQFIPFGGVSSGDSK
ncbi:MAG: LPS-assembly protein LptD [Sulfurovum sp.]|nr:LPS-assembly protein LptD [Sulfurovum sp.]